MKIMDDKSIRSALISAPQPAAGWDEAISAAAKWHESEAAHARTIYSEMDRYSDDHEERAGWRSYKDKEDRHLSYAAHIRSLRREAPAPAEGVKPSSIVTCCVTGAIPGDGGACGDCDPCVMGAASVPEPVKRLIAEKNSLLQRVGELEDAALAARSDTAEARKGIVPLADHAAIGMMLVEKVPHPVYAAIVTITAHCAALQLDPSPDRVFDLGGCISQECMTLAQALSQPLGAEARLREA